MRGSFHYQNGFAARLTVTLAAITIVASMWLGSVGVTLGSPGGKTGKAAAKKVKYTDPASGDTVEEEWPIPKGFEDGPGDTLIREKDKKKFRLVVDGYIYVCPKCGNTHGQFAHYNIVAEDSPYGDSMGLIEEKICPRCKAKQNFGKKNIIYRTLVHIARFIMPNRITPQLEKFEEKLVCSVCGRTIKSKTYYEFVKLYERPLTSFEKIEKTVCNYCKSLRKEGLEIHVGEEVEETKEEERVTVKEITELYCKDCGKLWHEFERELSVPASQAGSYPKVIEDREQACRECRLKNKYLTSWDDYKKSGGT